MWELVGLCLGATIWTLQNCPCGSNVAVGIVCITFTETADGLRSLYCGSGPHCFTPPWRNLLVKQVSPQRTTGLSRKKTDLKRRDGFMLISWYNDRKLICNVTVSFTLKLSSYLATTSVSAGGVMELTASKKLWKYNPFLLQLHSARWPWNSRPN